MVQAWLDFQSAAAKSLQSCPTLCDPVDGSPPGSPVPGILPVWTVVKCRSQSRLAARCGTVMHNTQILLPSWCWLQCCFGRFFCLFIFYGLPRWLSGKESACQCRRCGFGAWLGKIPWRRKWQPIPVLLPGKSHGQRNLACYSPWGHKESETTECLITQNIFNIILIIKIIF